MIRFVANCFYIILALLFSFFQSFNIFFFMFFITFFSFVEIVSWHYEKSNTDVEMLTIQTFDFVFLLFWAFSDCIFFFVPFFVLCRFTRITTHSCYTVGYFAWGSLNTVLRHVRTYNRKNNNQLKNQLGNHVVINPCVVYFKIETLKS